MQGTNLTAVEAALDKSERERLFDTHIDELIAKKKTAFRSLLDEHKDVGLDAVFKDINKTIKEDPRCTKFSTLDKKCEKEFVACVKDSVQCQRGQQTAPYRNQAAHTQKPPDD